MKTYVFINDKNKNLEAIKLITYTNDKIECTLVGDIYSLIIYIVNNIEDSSNIKFLNFKIDKLNFILSSISRFKTIIKLNQYNDITITNKVKIRGR